jgi:hypothetical protein
MEVSIFNLFTVWVSLRLEVNGKTAQDDWLAVKYVVKTFDELIDLVTEIDQRCRQDRGF